VKLRRPQTLSADAERSCDLLGRGGCAARFISGRKVCAAVVFSEGPVSLAQLNAYLEERGVAAHARPDMLVAMPALPTTPIGKIRLPESVVGGDVNQL
jgi:hypothetical protein